MLSHAWPTQPLYCRDTVVMIGMDKCGHLAAATSTSGWPYKYPGRVGDSPIIGAGLYACDGLGACVCTHTGEMSIRAATAASVVRYMKKGADVESACREAADDLQQLKGGYLDCLLIHAVDRAGTPFALAVGSGRTTFYCWLWTEENGLERLPLSLPTEP